MRASLLRVALAAAPVLLAAGCATTTSRPGLVRPAGTVAPGHVQLEAGYTRAELDGRRRHLVGETLVRVGVLPRTELRGGWASYQRTITDAATVEGARASCAPARPCA